MEAPPPIGPPASLMTEGRVDRLDRRGRGWVVTPAGRVPCPGALPGERVKLAITEDARGRRRGRVLGVLEASADRVDPACVQFGQCPGCPLRHASPEFEETHHARVATQALRLETLLQVTSPTSRDGFRSRAVARAGPSDDGHFVLGLGGLDGYMVDLSVCPAQTPDSRAALSTATALMLAARLEADIETVAVTTSIDGRLRLSFCLRTEDGLLRLRSAVATLPPGVSVTAKVSAPRSRDAEYDAQVLAGDPSVLFEVDGEPFISHPPSWVPQSPKTVSQLRADVVAALDARGSTVLEIGCGVGTTTRALAELAVSVTAIDRERQAIADARLNLAGFGNVDLRVGLAAHAVRKLLSRGARFDRALLHGMRLPFGPEALRFLPALGVKRLVYLAPSAKALDADLEALPGARLTSADVFVQMPGTSHALVRAVVELG